jgi:putative tryptophan/tyrosine transport system substrate-binding protein
MADAQENKPIRRVAALMTYSAIDPQVQERNAAFPQGLQQLGWTVGQNLKIDYRWSAANEDDTRKYAAELVALAPDVILASGSAGLGPLRRATRTVPGKADIGWTRVNVRSCSIVLQKSLSAER